MYIHNPVSHWRTWKIKDLLKLRKALPCAHCTPSQSVPHPNIIYFKIITSMTLHLSLFCVTWPTDCSLIGWRKTRFNRFSLVTRMFETEFCASSVFFFYLLFLIDVASLLYQFVLYVWLFKNVNNNLFDKFDWLSKSKHSQRHIQTHTQTEAFLMHSNKLRGLQGAN